MGGTQSKNDLLTAALGTKPTHIRATDRDQSGLQKKQGGDRGKERHGRYAIRPGGVPGETKIIHHLRGPR